MSMPQLSPAHHKLEKFVGQWRGEERIYPSPFDPNGGTAMARIENRLALAGFAVVQDYGQERGNQPTFQGHAVLRYEPAQQCYEMHWFDSMGMPPSVFRGNFEGEVITLTSKGEQGHSRATFDFSVAEQYKFRMEVSPDGKQWFPFMEGQYARSR